MTPNPKPRYGNPMFYIDALKTLLFYADMSETLLLYVRESNASNPNPNPMS